jgi:hypothetical protein
MVSCLFSNVPSFIWEYFRTRQVPTAQQEGSFLMPVLAIGLIVAVCNL